MLVSQGWDDQSITHIAFARRSIPGQPNVMTDKLDIFVKPEALINHGCDGALSHAGTDNQCLTKKITYPPARITLGRNPSAEAADLLSEGLLRGQYLLAPDAPVNSRPPQGEMNGLLETATGMYLPGPELGKTWLKRIVKIGSCPHCWGPKHERGDICLYKEHCRECLAVIRDLPHSGFHHSCWSLIESVPDPKTADKENNGKRKYSDFDPGTPADPNTAVYIPSPAMSKAALVRERAEAKQKLRKDSEAAAVAEALAQEAVVAEAAARAAAADHDHNMGDILTDLEIEVQNQTLGIAPDI